jgi:hypothetical protein
MTKKQKKAKLRRAAAAIANEEVYYTCVAIASRLPWEGRTPYIRLREAYSAFYEFDDSVPQAFGEDIQSIDFSSQLARSLALLFYAEQL